MHIDTGDPLLDLLAAVVRRAKLDALRGDSGAQRWLTRFLDGVSARGRGPGNAVKRLDF